MTTEQQPRRQRFSQATVAVLALAIAGLLMPFLAPPARAADSILVVDTWFDDPAATACTTAPTDCSLRGALMNANGDGVAEIETISVPAGTYDLTVVGDSNVAGSLNVRASVVLVGAGAASTIIDAQGIDRVLVVNGEGPPETRTLTASGFTFRGGRPCNELGGNDDGGNLVGGGLFIHGVANLSDVIVEDNLTCGAGGGIFVDQYASALTLTRSIVRGNTALQGAGGIESDFSLTMIDSTVSGNVADRSTGGGMRLAGVATITGSTISNNIATRNGGGITTGDDTTSACCAATVTITNSTISGNVAHWWNSGTPQYFPGVAAGIHVGRSRFTLRHVTVTANVAETNPNYGAVGRAGGIGGGYTNFVTLENSIVAGNFANEECLFEADTTYLAPGSFGCSMGGLQDPQLGSLASNGGPTKTHDLASGSPALDGGMASLCSPTDQRGEPRPSGAGCDMGAFELQVAAPPPPPPPPPGADAVLVITSAYSLPSHLMTDDPGDFRFDVVRGATSLAAFDGNDLYGPTGPTGYVLGVDLLDPLHGDAIRVALDAPAGWLPVFSGDCAADGSLRLRPGQVRTCAVTNTHLDEYQPASTAAVVIDSSFGTPPTVDLRNFDVVLDLASDVIFDFDAQDMGQAGRRTLGFAVPADATGFGIGITVHAPAGWLAILGADCAEGHFFLEPGRLTGCTIEWFEVGTGADAVLVITSAYSLPSHLMTDDPGDFRFDVVRGATSLAAFDGNDLYGPTGPTGYVLGVDLLDPLHGDAIRVALDAPAGWLPVFSGDCAADGSLRLRPGQVRTCAVTNTHLDEYQPASTAAVVIDSSFGTPPTVDLRNFDVVLDLASDVIFDFDAQDMGQAGRRTLGFAVPADATGFGIGITVHAPAGWLAILGADCAEGHFFLEPGRLTGCTIEWFEVGTGADAVLVITSAYSLPSHLMTDDPGDFRFDVVRGATSLAAFDGNDLYGPTGPTGYVLGVDLLDPLHGDAIRVALDAPAGWLPVFSGDCAADGSLRLRPGQVRTCAVTNTHLDEYQPASTAAVVIDSSFGTPPTVDLRNFDVVLDLASDVIFDFDAQDMGQAGRRTLGFAVPADATGFGIGITVHAPAGWLAILGADCAEGHFFLEPGRLTGCTIEWFEVGTGADPIVDLVVTDCSASSLATVTVVTGNLIVTDPTCQALSLPNLASIEGDLVIANNPTLTALSLPDLGRIAGDLLITGNPSLLDIDLASLAFVGGSLVVTQNSAVDELATAATAIGGDIDVSQNATLTVITMPEVETIGGDMTMTANPTLTTIDMPSVTVLTGDMDVSGNTSLVDVTAPTLTIIGGDIDVSNNASMSFVSAPTLTTIGGDMDISADATLTMISMPVVETIGGDMTLTSNPTLTTISMPSVTVVTGDMDISGNATLTGGAGLVLRLPALISVGGSMVISDNVRLVTVGMPDVEAIGGDMVLTGNPTLTTFDAPSLETVGGDMTLELQAATIELAAVSVAGDSTIVGTGTEMLIAETALGTTSFELLNGLATVQTTLPLGTFETNVAYRVESLTGADLDPQGSIDPLAAYRFDFAVPALGVNALVSFTIDLDALASTERQVLIDAIASGRATLAVRSDGTTTFQAMTVCGIGQTPAANGCIQVVREGSTITFDGVAGHFSTWAVVVVAAPDVIAPVVTVPADKRLEATGQTGRIVDFAGQVSSVDDRDGAVGTVCDPGSGATFPIGVTVVTCRAVDAAGNTGSASFRVTIVDTTGPAVIVPSNVTVTATSSTGAVVTFIASATDLVSGPRTVVCTPASGTRFSIGQTTVTCRASDAAGNVGTGSFVVRVLGPVDLLTSLRNDVSATPLPLAPKLAAELKGKLDDAITKLGQKKADDACKKVLEFVTKVEQERTKHTIPAAIADDWLARARLIRTLLGC